MPEIISNLLSKITELSSRAKSKIHAKQLAYILTASLTLSWCGNYEKKFDASYDQESTLTELLTDYKETQKKNSRSNFETADYSADIALGDTISKNLIQFINTNPRRDRILYIIDLPWYLDLVINKNLKKNGINTTFDVNIDYSDDGKLNDVDYSKFFWVMNKIGDGGPNDQHVAEKKDGVITTKPYALLFDYNRINEWLNDFENEKTFHNQYTIEDELPSKEMFKGEGAMREKIIVFTNKKMNQDLAWWLMELAKIDDIPVDVVVIDETWNLVGAEVPVHLKTTWQEAAPTEANTTHSSVMPFWYRYILGRNTSVYNNTYRGGTHESYRASSHENYYSSWCKQSSFKSNGVVTKTTPAHFQKSNPIRTSSRFSGGSSIRSS